MRMLILISMISLPLAGFTQEPILFIRTNTKIENLILAPPATYLFEINTGNKLELDTTLSEGGFRYLSAQLQKSIPNHVSSTSFPTDSAVRSKLSGFVLSINREFTKEKRIEKYMLPDSILRLFDNSKTNYVLCVYNVGFKRIRENLLDKQQKNEIAAFLFGISTPPLEFSSVMSFCILDLQEKNIFYFEKDIAANKDPTDVKVIKMQLARLIAHCFI